ncbi:iron complex transport system substrate-binding protein [Nakamurella panacisegetis]|uniref:Iron complex transport system substrate-binding protein n=1 Tax=Nakamurella panacisegetis TaxID=1090615 RepID=A0A1H0R2X8_9ACTN|nr:iron-siderophore ABC transporter substrate-binding protein [Nakamurella panacisegetis]SDP23348.1 iron complex transport system substrate-binding protein [Nakamurella panacisegetis]
MSLRLLRTGAAVLAVAALLSACSSSSSSNATGGSTDRPASSANAPILSSAPAASSSAASSAASSAGSASGSPAATSSAAAASFPVTIPNAFGSTVIPSEPKRVVVIGYTETDTVLALGVVPVGIQQWIAGYDSGVGPWARSLLGSATPTVFAPTAELNVEQVASLKPDLIIGLNRQVTKEVYVQLSAIAPTLVRPARYSDYGVPQDVQAALIGRAMGKESEIKAKLAAVDSEIAAAKTANPAFAGKTVSVDWPRSGGQGWYAYTDIDPRLNLMTALGFEQAPAVAALGNKAFYVEVSRERTSEIDADVVVMLDIEKQRQAVEADALYKALPAVKAGHVVWVTDTDVTSAFSYASVLSLPYALDKIVPELAKAAA